MFQFFVIFWPSFLHAQVMALLTPPSLAACAGHTLLDLDKPFCHLGVTALLHRLLPALGRDYLVRILKPHVAQLPPPLSKRAQEVLHNLRAPTLACKFLLGPLCPQCHSVFWTLADKWFIVTWVNGLFWSLEDTEHCYSIVCSAPSKGRMLCRDAVVVGHQFHAASSQNVIHRDLPVFLGDTDTVWGRVCGPFCCYIHKGP